MYSKSDKFYKRQAVYFWDKIGLEIIRPITYGVSKTAITPNCITLVNFIVIFPATCVAAMMKKHIIMVILLQIYMLLDNMDGGLARLKNMCSELGRKLDIISDYAMYSVGMILIAHSLGTRMGIILFEQVAQWGYAFIATKFISPSIRKLEHFNKTKIKAFFENRLHLLFGMDLGVQACLILFFGLTEIGQYIFAICGILWTLDCVFRCCELYFLNLKNNYHNV